MIFNFFRFKILFIFVLGTSTTLVYSFSNNVTDEQALLSFKHSITADPLRVLASWNNSDHFCHWTGITCSRRRQRVTLLNLTSQHLVGTLSPRIGNLSFLRGIDLGDNHFHGLIPNEIGRLFRLQDLDLGENSFQGGIPADLGRCTDIRYIRLYSNHLEGELAFDFGSWSKLDVLDLCNNHFTGSIPPSIGNMSSLGFLRLSQNSLSGMVPLSLYNVSSLYMVSLAQNELKGTLLSNLGFTLPKLQEFYFGGNKFTGPLPPSIVNASNVVSFDIIDNKITGPIPNNLGSLLNLQRLSLDRNPLGDNMWPNDWSFFNSLVNCTHLKILGLGQINLRGNLPNSIANLSTTLEQLYMHDNYIHGSIPHDIEKLVNMKLLALQDNFITGSITQSIGRLSKLGALDLSGNNISGVIPTSIKNITQLVRLHLDSNALQGSIPTQLFNISTLEMVNLDNNRFRGAIPDEIMFLSHCLYLDLSYNLFNGQLPSNIGSLKQLATLALSHNKLRGDIPVTLGGCVMLEELYMDGNLFQGKIPSSFKELKSLAFLGLSNNNISGSVPSFFGGFPMLEFLNLSHNKLEGEVPKGGLFSNVSAFSVVGNLELCGGIQTLHLHACPKKVSRNKKKTFAPLGIILILVPVPLGMLLACLAFISYRRRNSKKLNGPVLVLKDDQYPKLSYQDLVLATDEFSPDNLVGAGRYSSVYKGNVELVEHVVAVKVLNVEISGAKKTFLTECETLRNIRHRNLIKIITACSSIDFNGKDFKALVFEFMTNGSLDSWLHPSPSNQGNERNLTLLQRLNIAIDVALGLDYLHHHSNACIIHSDIKPSNILLDEDFVAHIGDFGLARLSFPTTSDINEAQTSITGVRGTIGYVPPEYGMWGEISTEGDVYSYGILLLEIFSGNRPTENCILIEGCNNLHDYVRKALPQKVMDITDPRILLDQEEQFLPVLQSYNRDNIQVCLASIYEVGILCSEEMPQNRIDITVAIKQLQVARDKLACEHLDT